MATDNNFAPAPPEVLAVVGNLINTYFPALIAEPPAVLIRPTPMDAGKGEDGQPIVTVAAAGINTDAALPVDYIIWFAWDLWQLLDERERNAIVFHELHHCGRDANGKAVLNPHDESVFTSEVELYGAWWKQPHEYVKQLTRQNGGK